MKPQDRFWILLASLALLALFFSECDAAVGPESWGAVKHHHMDNWTDLELDALQDAPDAAGKPIMWRGSYRTGAHYSVRFYAINTYPRALTRYESTITHRAREVQYKKFDFARDGGRIFEVLDVLYGQLEAFAEEEKPTLLLFNLSVVSKVYQWEHVRYHPDSPQYMGALRMTVDAWWWEFKNGRRFYVSP